MVGQAAGYVPWACAQVEGTVVRLRRSVGQKIVVERSQERGDLTRIVRRSAIEHGAQDRQALPLRSIHADYHPAAVSAIR